MTARVRRGVALVGGMLAGFSAGVWLDSAGVTGNNDSDMGTIGLGVGLGLGLMAAALVRDRHD